VSTDPHLPPDPQGDYATAVVHAGVAYSAGMTPRRDGQLTITGVVGSTVSVERAWAAARLAAANALAAVRAVLPANANVRCLRMTVYIACASDFHDLSAVADGASDAIVNALGECALPARSAIGVQCLPAGSPVEVELVATTVPA
jgi:enamine deaminase RidA (YjgF/YER057c/UK114 family)